MSAMTTRITDHTTRLHGAIGLLLALCYGAAGAAAPAVKAPADRNDAGPRCIGEAARPGKMTLIMGKSTLMRLPEPVRHRSVGNAAVAQAMLVAPDTLYLLGVDVGTTNMIIQGKSGACSMVDIMVTMDPVAIESAMALALPDEKDIKVTSANETIVLTGSVSSGDALLRAGELANAFVIEESRSLARLNDDAGTAARGAAGTDKAAGKVRVINMLSVSAPQQVMLEVKIAEVSKTLLERLEGTATWRFGGSSSWATTLVANFITGAAAGGFDAVKRGDPTRRLTAEAQRQDGLVRILAEPNVMAVSGQEGSFLAGGRIFIPVAQENNRVTLEEKEFGVGLRFTPTVLAGGRINLHVSPEVSEVSREGVGISASGFTAGAVLPLITTRRASTTVQLYDGQSFAIGGLIKNNLVTTMKGLPLLGEIPVLGALFRSADYQHDRSELVFVVTVHLVKPLAPNYALPTDKVGVPGRARFLLGGVQEAAEAKPGAAGPAAANVSPAPRAGVAVQDSPRGFEIK
jgi:pilus assembly protein CpaC